MFSTLPDLVDPVRAADSGSAYAGCLPLSSFPRLCGLLLDTAGDVDFNIAFGRDQELRVVVKGEIDARLTLRCQRCLQPMEHRVHASTELAVVAGIDEAQRLPDRYEPLLVTEKMIRPRDLIEDELLLSLPQIPRHELGSCGAQQVGRSAPAAEERGVGSNPFAELAALKRGPKN